MERKLTAMRLGCRRRIRLRKEGGSWIYSPYPSRRERLGLCTTELTQWSRGRATKKDAKTLHGR